MIQTGGCTMGPIYQAWGQMLLNYVPCASLAFCIQVGELHAASRQGYWYLFLLIRVLQWEGWNLMRTTINTDIQPLLDSIMLFLSCWISFPCLSCDLGSTAGVLCRCFLRFTALSSLDHCSPKTWVSHNENKSYSNCKHTCGCEGEVGFLLACWWKGAWPLVLVWQCRHLCGWQRDISPFLGHFGLERWIWGWE